MEIYLLINFAVLALLGGLGLVLFKAPLHSALSFIVCLVAVAGLYLLLNAKTLFLVQIVVYAGAIMVLSVFIMMFFNIQTKYRFYRFCFADFLALIPAFIIVFLVGSLLLNQTHLSFSDSIPNGFGEMKELGLFLYSKWGLAFEAVSVLLTAALVGIVAILKGRANV